MSAPVRFLAVAVAGWVTFRAAASALDLPQLVPARVAQPPQQAQSVQPWSAAGQMAYAPLPAVPAGAGASPTMPYPPPYPAAYPYPVLRPMPVAMPLYYPAPASPAMPPPGFTPLLSPGPQAVDFSGMPETDEAPLSRPVAVNLSTLPGGLAVTSRTPPPGPPGLDRWSLSSWALMRQETPAAFHNGPTNPALAVGGQLGGSQAGARLAYRFNRRLGIGLRFSAPIPAAGSARQQIRGEAALGVAWQPLESVPLRLMAERRQRVGGPDGGRNAFAVLAEGGVYARPLPLGFRLDGYGQAGVVSLRSRDWFVDGGATAVRPLFGRYSAGIGMWGGAQHGLRRLDIGPRVSMQLLRGITTHVDYRWRALGTAQPGSGYAITMTGDF